MRGFVSALGGRVAFFFEILYNKAQRNAKLHTRLGREETYRSRTWARRRYETAAWTRKSQEIQDNRRTPWRRNAHGTRLWLC